MPQKKVTTTTVSSGRAPARTKKTVTQQTKQNPKPTTRSNPTMKQMVPSGLSPCASKYARALANPFSGPLACIPNFPALMSQKSRPFVKGTFSTGTTGFGGIVYDPFCSAVNDIICVVTTSATYATSALPTISTAGASLAYSNAEYQTASFNTTAQSNQYRIVGAGVRVRYIGTELNRGGQLIGLLHPQHDTLSGLTLAQVDAFDESERLSVSHDKWSTVLYRPIDADDLSFSPGGGVDPGNAFPVPGDSYIMGFAVQAASAGTSLAYEYECYAVIEYNGPNIRAKDPSHVDGPGFDAVHAATAFTAHLKPTQNTSESVMAKFEASASDYLQRGMSWAWGEVKKFGGTVASDLVASL